MNKILKGVIGCAAVAVILALSIRIERLDTRTTTTFDPTRQVEQFWTEQLPKLLAGDRVVDAELFDAEVKNNRQLLIDRYGLTLGIGAPYSMLLGGVFRLEQLDEELAVLKSDGGATLSMRTAYIFGNTVREATGAFSIDDFENTMDFNHIAMELNRMVSERVIQPATEWLKEGARLRIIGAIDIPIMGQADEHFEVIPLLIQPAE